MTWNMDWCNRHREVFADGDGCGSCDLERNAMDAHRAALTRALTAQAWGVACCWLEDTGRELIVSPEYHCLEFCERMAKLPSPAELAEEILG